MPSSARPRQPTSPTAGGGVPSSSTTAACTPSPHSSAQPPPPSRQTPSRQAPPRQVGGRRTRARLAGARRRSCSSSSLASSPASRAAAAPSSCRCTLARSRRPPPGGANELLLSTSRVDGLGEISPAHLRGTLGSAFLLTAVTGVLHSPKRSLTLSLLILLVVISLSGMLLAQVLGLPPLLGSDDRRGLLLPRPPARPSRPRGASRWRLVLLAVLPPAALQLLLLRHSLLESPRWLLLRGRDEAARTTLARLRGCRGGEVETAELHQELASMLPSPQGRPGGRRPASWPGGSRRSLAHRPRSTAVHQHPVLIRRRL